MRLHGRYCLVLLDKGQYVEALDFAVGKEAVHRLGLVVENLENGVDFGHHQQFDIAPVHVHQALGDPALSHSAWRT